MIKTKIFAIAGAAAAALGLAGSALAADPIINLPANFLSTSLAYIDGMFTDLWTLIALAIGLPLAFWVIRKAIGLVRARA